MKKLLIIVLVGLFMFPSCSPTQKIQQPSPVQKDTTVPPPVIKKTVAIDSAAIIDSNYKQLMKNRIDVKTFSAKINLEYTEQGGKKNKVNVNLRMADDSLIWVSATGLFGIEGMRALITRDSVFLLDKQNKTYTANSIAYLQQLTGLPFTLLTLQDLLLGNPVFFDANILHFEKQNEQIILWQHGNVFTNKLTIDGLSKMPVECLLSDIDTSQGRNCQLTYDNYEIEEGISFAQHRLIHVFGKKEITVELEFKQYKFNETLSFPFKVPKNYTEN